MQDEVIKVARLICNQMQDDDCACTSACGASIYAARAAMAATREIDAEDLRGLCLGETLPPRREREMFADWLQQRANEVKETTDDK